MPVLASRMMSHPSEVAVLNAGRIAQVADVSLPRRDRSRSPELYSQIHCVLPWRDDNDVAISAQKLGRLSRHPRDSCHSHMRTCARCFNAARSASAMRRRSTVINPRLKILHRDETRSDSPDHLSDRLMREASPCFVPPPRRVSSRRAMRPGTSRRTRPPILSSLPQARTIP
jgi:hypothetical protein